MLLADYYLETDTAATAAQTLWNSLALDFPKDKSLKTLRGYQINLIQNDKTYQDIGGEGSPGEAVFEAIAWGDTSVAAMQARAILELINDTIYALPWEAFEDSGSLKWAAESNSELEKTLHHALEPTYRIIPTLIAGEAVGIIIAAPEETGRVEIYAVDGRMVFVSNLSGGENRLDLQPLSENGVYIYKVWIEDRIVHTDKLIRIKGR